jgi:MarR family transcriptional regulator, organic hydroperoxide resistance regulator
MNDRDRKGADMISIPGGKVAARWRAGPRSGGRWSTLRGRLRFQPPATRRDRPAAPGVEPGPDRGQAMDQDRVPPPPVRVAAAAVAYSAAPTTMARRKAPETTRPASKARSTRASSRAPLPDTLAFMQLLWAVDHGLRSLSKRMQQTLGITGPQRLCLRLLGRSPGAAPSELAAWLHIDRGTLTGILDRLVQHGLVRRKPDPADGRRVQLELTAAGRRYDRESSGTVEAAVRRSLAALPPARVTAARDVLEAISRELAREDNRDP